MCITSSTHPAALPAQWDAAAVLEAHGLAFTKRERAAVWWAPTVPAAAAQHFVVVSSGPLAIIAGLHHPTRRKGTTSHDLHGTYACWYQGVA